MLSEDTKILEFNQYHKSAKAPFIIYADLECLLEKIDRCKNNPENSFTSNVSAHILSGFSMSTVSSIKSIENKHDVYRGKDCMKKFCESLSERETEIINFKKKKMKLLTKEQQESYKMQKYVISVTKNLKVNMCKIKDILKLEIIVIMLGEYKDAAHSICNLKNSV